jgi:hypothetical protein
MNKNSTIIYTFNEFTTNCNPVAFNPESLFDEVNVEAEYLQSILKELETDVSEDVIKKLYERAYKA